MLLKRFFALARRVPWRRLFLLLIVAWMLLACGLVATVHFYGQTDRAEQADVIIVLGAGVRRDNRPGPALIRRSTQGAELWQDGYAPRVICAGGIPGYATRSEADACRELLEERGVPADAIILEERSRSTHENAVYSLQIMQANGWDKAIIVSDGYHMLRAGWIFSSAGVNAVTSPATTTPRRLEYVWAVGREVVALHWQALVYLFNLPVTFVPWL
jgi:uncharacterized SAM-binding protein YcdF (DUF218 family)